MSSLLKQHHLFLSITSMLVLSACGGAGSKDPSGYNVNAQMSAVTDLSAAERTIATRICYAYQSKSSSFRSQTYNGKTFTYNMASKNCVDTKASYSLNAVLSSTSSALTMTPTPDSDLPFQKVVQTAQSGYLSQLCTKIQNNQAISNTATTTSSKTKTQIVFFRDTLDSYTLRYFAPNSAGEMKIESAETYKVRTQFNITASQILGMDESYSIQQTCGSSDKFSEFTQTFSSYK